MDFGKASIPRFAGFSFFFAKTEVEHRRRFFNHSCFPPKAKTLLNFNSNGKRHSHLTMEANPRRRVLPRRRNPLSDCTNTIHSSSSSSVPLKPSSSSSFNKPPTKRISDTNTSTNLHKPSNPSSPPSPILSTPSPKTSSLHASTPISVVYSRRSASNKRKDKGKAVAIPVSKTPIPSIFNSWEKSDRVEGANVPKAKALTVPCRKKHRAVSSEQDVLKDPLVQDFIEKQKAYFKAIDEFELPVEEVESDDEQFELLEEEVESDDELD